MLTFIYSTVNAGKSANLIMRAHSCGERNINHTVFVPEIAAQRDGNQRISSRIGLERMGCVSLRREDCPFEIISERSMRTWEKTNPVQVVFVDEAQFLTKRQVIGLARIADELNVPVFAYGLRTDFKGEPFEGSIYLMAWSDRIEEIATFGKMNQNDDSVERAVFNMKVDELGKQITEGESVSPGFGYEPVSRKRFGLPNIHKKS